MRKLPEGPAVSAGANIEKRRTLEPVGVSEPEECLYETLLEHPGASLPELADFIKQPRRKTQLVLGALELKGLVTHSPERVRRYFPTPPDVAVEALILKQQEALQRVRAVAARLQEKARKARGASNTDERVIEIITGREALSEILDQMQRSARKEVICFDRPPYVYSTLNKTEFEVMGRGVCYRTIYDRSALEFPGAAGRIRAYLQSGEEGRVFPGVPLKLFAADRRNAILPLDLQHPEGAILLVRSCSLLDALYELFEAIWVRAAPISFGPSGRLEIGHAASRLPADAERIIPLLAAGLNDKTIVQQLGISQRTLNRHMKEIMEALDAKTRFQAGWQGRAVLFQSNGKGPR